VVFQGFLTTANAQSGGEDVSKAFNQCFHRQKGIGMIIRRAMDRLYGNYLVLTSRRGGMELVQVAILVAIAVVVGIFFRHKIADFVQAAFADLQSGTFTEAIPE